MAGFASMHDDPQVPGGTLLNGAKAMPPTITPVNQRTEITRTYDVSDAEPLQMLRRGSKMIPTQVVVTFVNGDWTRVQIFGDILTSAGTRLRHGEGENRYSPKQHNKLPEWVYPLLVVEQPDIASIDPIDVVDRQEDSNEPPTIAGLKLTPRRMAILASIRDGLVREDWYAGVPGNVFRDVPPWGIQQVTAEVGKMKTAGWCRSGTSDDDMSYRKVELTDEGTKLLAEHGLVG